MAFNYAKAGRLQAGVTGAEPTVMSVGSLSVAGCG